MTEQEQRDARPERKFAGMPFDLRRPTAARFQQRLWNREDARFFTPKTFGWGYDINFYWLAHPASYVKSRRSA